MMLFAVNPNGIRTDATTKNDMINGMNMILILTSIHSGMQITKINGNVWQTEIRIPLSSLRFQGNTDKVIMGIIILKGNCQL